MGDGVPCEVSGRQSVMHGGCNGGNGAARRSTVRTVRVDGGCRRWRCS